MKYFCVFVFLFISINSKAQFQEILTQYDWFLYSVEIDSQDYLPPSNEEVTSVPLFFYDTNSNIDFETVVCNSAFAGITIDDSNYSFTFNEELTFTLVLCNNEDNSVFEGLYFGFYHDYVTEIFTCEIIIIDDGSGNELISLNVQNLNGDIAYYNNYLLSVDDIAISNTSIYPNPVEEEFFFTSVSGINLVELIIYDINGKLIFSKKMNDSENSVNIKNLNNGIYFVTIKDENGNTSVKRLIKK